MLGKECLSKKHVPMNVNLKVRLWSLLLLGAISAHAAEKCDRAVLSRDAVYLFALDSLRSDLFWRDGVASSPYERDVLWVGVGDKIRVLCFEGLSQCYVYGGTGSLDDTRLLFATQFHQSVHLGQLAVTSTGTQMSSPPGEVPARSPAIASGIADPLKAWDGKRDAERTLFTFYRPCVTSLSDFGGLLPDAVRRRRRPQLAEEVVAAVRKQGLTVGGNSVLIPFFIDGSTTFGIELIGSSRKPEFLLVNVAGGWIRFGPVDPANAKEFSEKLRSVRMVAVGSDAVNWY